MDQASATERRRIAVLGKTGCGKSSTANTILGGELFTVDHDASSGTKQCDRKKNTINGKEITVVDTPGFFDTDQPETDNEITTFVTNLSNGVHAFLIVLKVEKYSPQEREIVQKIVNSFSEEALKYAVVLFTQGDQLRSGDTIEKFVGTNKKLDELVQKCGGRCHVIDNKHWNQEDDYRSNKVQVEKLMNTIEEMVAQNGGRCYTNEMLQAVEEAIQQEEMVISQESGERFTGTEIRQRAEEAVAWKIRGFGVGAGAILGALLGIPVGATVGMLYSANVFLYIITRLKEAGAAEPNTATGAPTGVGGIAAAAAAAGGTVTSVFSYTLAGASCVAVAATAGGTTGYEAAENAKSPGEAAVKACNAVLDGVKTMLTKAWEEFKK